MLFVVGSDIHSPALQKDTRSCAHKATLIILLSLCCTSYSITREAHGLQRPPPQNLNLKNKDFVDLVTSNVLRH
jgi:hypothetical protein